MNNLILLFLLFITSCFSSTLWANPIYIGLTGGFGSTTWGKLVPSEGNSSLALNLSTPTDVSEGGTIYGCFAGFEIIPAFAIEASYTHYPTAKIEFDPTSLFTFDHDGLTEFTTHTESAALMGKLQIEIPNTLVHAYSSAGVAGVHRNDMITNRWRLSPTFGIGLTYPLTEKITGEFGINYTDGYGESELNPAEDYIPFLYSGFIRIAYRF